MNPFLTLVFWFGVTALAVFRVAELLVFDDGPAAIFLRVRAWTGMYDRDEFGKPYANATRGQRGMGGLLECPFCVGMWVALVGALWLAFVSNLSVSEAFVMWLALAGAQAFFESVGGRVWRS